MSLAWDTWGTQTIGGTIYCIAQYGSLIYIGGTFLVNGVNFNGIAKWDGTNFTQMGPGFNGAVLSICTDPNGNVYVSGTFTQLTNFTPMNKVSKWNGTSWSTMNTGPSGASTDVRYMISDGGNNIYALGNFVNMGPITARGIARWSISQNGWFQVGLATNTADIYTGLFNNGILYVGGQITVMGGQSVNNIAQFNGTAWSRIGPLSTGPQSIVRSIAFLGNDIYTGGAGQTTVVFAKYDAGLNTWTQIATVPGGSGQSISSVVNFGEELYIGGNFTALSGDTSLVRFCKWNGTSFVPFGTGANNSINYMLVDNVTNDKLYIVGGFSNIDGNVFNRRAILYELPPPPEESAVTNYDGTQDDRFRAGQENALASSSVTFDTPFSGTPLVIIGDNQAGVIVTGKSSTGFTYTASNLPNLFNWFAILI